jgi:hypothetical protein
VLLAAVGLYGLMTYAVIRDGLTVTLGGVGIGFFAALATSVLVKSLLFGISNRDRVTLFVAPTSLIVITVAACLFPAARASRVDPRPCLARGIGVSSGDHSSVSTKEKS